MKKRHYFSFALCLLIGAAGLLVKGFAGGFLVGASGMLISVITVGRWLLIKAVAKVEKLMADRNSYNSKTYDDEQL